MFLIRSWQNQQGLPNNTIKAVTQTHDGYLWLGTDAGLARFDGVRSEVFGLHEGLKNLQVSALVEDRRGNLWIGTAGGGVARMYQGAITNYTTRDGLAGDSVSSLMEATNGDIWIGTQTGLSRWHNGRFLPVAKELGPMMVFDLAKDRQGGILAATLHHGLLRFQDDTYSLLYGQAGRITNNPRCVLVDHQDRIWVGLREKQVMCCANGTWTTFGTNEGFPPVVTYHLAESADGTVWAGSWNEGLYYLKNGRFHALQKKDGLSDDGIVSFFQGRDRFLWVGTQSGGLNRIGPGNVKVDYVMEGTSECQLRSLAQTTDGQIWAGTYGQGLYRWQGNQSIPFTPGEPSGSHLLVEAVLSGRDGSLWWGAATALTQWKDGNVIIQLGGWEPWLNGDHILCLAEDRDAGIWIGTFNGKVGLLKQKTITTLPGLSGKPVTSMVQAPDGTLWIGSLGGGLGRWRAGSLTVFTTRDGLQSDLIRSLLLEPDGTLWIGTDGGGLNRWSQGRMAGFSKAQGLQDDIILQILADDDGCLWLGCNRGIYRVTKRTLNDVARGDSPRLRPLKFGIAEGLASEQCVGNFGAAIKTRDGKLRFATTAGIVVIDPHRQANAPNLPVALMEEGYWDDQPISKLPAAGTAEASPTIPPGNHRFEFHYTGIDFASPEKIRFRYRLEGLDHGWTEAGEARVARYSFLPPGKYRFCVQAGHLDGPWNETGAGLNFAKAPYFWQTGWFEAIAALTLTGLMAVGIRLAERRRYRARLRRIEQEQAMQNERVRIARDLHDQLGSQLTHISMLSDISQPAARPEARLEKLEKRVRQISEVAVHTVRSLDEIVWAVNPRNDTVRSLAEYLTQFLRELIESTRIDYRFQIDEDLPEWPLPPDLRHNLFLAVKEAVNNAVKHSRASLVILGVKCSGSQLEIYVQDDGAGFDAAAVRRREGCGLQNMRQRIESLGGQLAIESGPGKGTTVRLILPHSAAAAN